jgi:hypothetical protein
VGDTVTIAFDGTQISYYALKAYDHGIAAVSLDGGAETMVDLYAPTVQGNQLVWTSPVLPAGRHTFRVRATGQKQASATDTYAAIDRVVVTAGSGSAVALAQASCAPRPAVTVATTPAGPGQLQVTITAATNPGAAPNLIQALQFGAATNALLDVPGGPTRAPGSFTYTLTPAAPTASFTLRRVTAGQATTAPVTVVDTCGSWPTFVGGGPNSF